MDAANLMQILTAMASPSAVTTLQFYGLVFLLGSFTVASLSDIKRMAAQKEFAEVWVAFALLAFCYDFIRLGETEIVVFAAKWVMIMLFAVLSWKYFGMILSLSEMDLAAACAAMSLLNPMYIAAYYLLLVLFKIMLRPILGRFGDGIGMPFLPVVLIATGIMLFAARASDIITLITGMKG
ncbi:MAG: hypothetical protein PHG85_02125 [Candidatus Altiarchaeota archaeon]|nr:hypothetical protein [Candidatus Altiarchaeota archaeon]